MTGTESAPRRQLHGGKLPARLGKLFSAPDQPIPPLKLNREPKRVCRLRPSISYRGLCPQLETILLDRRCFSSLMERRMIKIALGIITAASPMTTIPAAA